MCTKVVMNSSIFWDITPCNPLSISRIGLPSDFTLLSYSAYSTLKMEAIYSYETPFDFLKNARRYIPEDNTLQDYSSCPKIRIILLSFYTLFGISMECMYTEHQ
jgi:hypothetical protein